ncbi:unnamed protein product [Urochloa decumbens]|uniref:Gnk2-homologous domain-containing protein n=1 Tax=Urochloa decumbens TaxID=240449 RepID=A0ABC8YHA5_9POAL
MLLLLLLLVATAMADSIPGVAFAGDPTNRHRPPLLDCSSAPATATHNDSSFRANLASVLDGLPSIAAAMPGRLAVVKSADAGPHRAFARGVCFGGSSSAVAACLTCLTSAARDLAGGCRGSRRAGSWRDGCFMAYADSDASSSREGAFRGWFYAGWNTTPPALAGVGECLVYSGKDCERCINDPLRGAPPLGWLWRLRGGEVVVVSYACCLSIKISPNSQSQAIAKFWVWFTVATAALIIGVIFFQITLTLIRGLP